MSMRGELDRKYDPAFAQGGTHNILDIYRAHSMRTAHCGCSVCWMAREVIRRREAESDDTRPA